MPYIPFIGSRIRVWELLALPLLSDPAFEDFKLSGGTLRRINFKPTLEA